MSGTYTGRKSKNRKITSESRVMRRKLFKNKDLIDRLITALEKIDPDETYEANIRGVKTFVDGAFYRAYIINQQTEYIQKKVKLALK